MKATRVRVTFEYRDDGGHFVRYHRGELVSSDGEHDTSATDAAYLSALSKKEQHKCFVSQLLNDREPTVSRD